MELISREGAIEAITNYAKFLWKNYHETCNLAGMIDAIEALPTAGKVGKWVEQPTDGRFGKQVECSECGEVYWAWMANFGYCPNCGARMMEEEGADDGTDK